MSDSNLFDDLQECIDAMHHAVQQCASEESSVGEMWFVLDEQCQRLASFSAGEVPEDDDDEHDEDADAPSELNFDNEEDEDAEDEHEGESLQ